MRERSADDMGGVVWLTGCPCSGKSTIARLLAEAVREHGGQAELIDGDDLRRTTSDDLDFTPSGRHQQALRAATAAAEAAEAGALAIVALVSPFRNARAAAREIVGPRFIEVHVDAPLDARQERDVKGLYALARSGRITGLTGFSAPYEPPLSPALRLDTTTETPHMTVARLRRLLAHHPWTPFFHTPATPLAPSGRSAS